MAPTSNPPSGWSVGNDANNGLTRSTPIATLNRAFQIITSGQTLTIAAGTYSGVNNQITHIANLPPSGSQGNATLITAEDPTAGNVRFNNASFLIDGLSAARSWITFDGIQYTGNTFHQISGAAHTNRNLQRWTFKRCGFVGWVQLGYSQFVLFEDCYVTGQGRYCFDMFTSNDILLRRCVARLDNGDGSGQPISHYVNYTCQRLEWQNCIAIDTNDSFHSNYEGVYGGFYVRGPNTINTTTWQSEQTKARGCILLNVRNNGTPGGVFRVGSTMGNDAPGIEWINSIFWDMNSGISRESGASGSTTQSINHCVVGITRSASYNRHGWVCGNVDGAFQNSIFYSINDTAINDGLSSNFNRFFLNGADKFSVPTSSGDAQADPIWTQATPAGGLKHLPRIDSTGSFKSIANDGGDIGATIMFRYGVDGTFLGDTDYNTLTATALWPWPNEDVIRTFFINFGTGAGSPANARGFCTGTSIDGETQTLTKYIWEYLGNQIPVDIYGSEGTPTNNRTVGNIRIS